MYTFSQLQYSIMLTTFLIFYLLWMLSLGFQKCRIFFLRLFCILFSHWTNKKKKFYSYIYIYTHTNKSKVLLFVDFSKAFDSIHRGEMEQILLIYGLHKETFAAIMILYKNTKVKVQSPDGDTDYFDIVAGVLQGDALARFLFISNTPQNSSCTATYHPSQKPSKWDKPDMMNS